MYRICKQLRSFSAAHRITNGYQGKCRHLHGHNYDVQISFSADTLDQYGFVIDFDDITRFFDQWVQDHWDHCTLVGGDDHELLSFVTRTNQKHYLFEPKQNTTVENLTRHLFTKMQSIIDDNPEVFHPSLTLESVKLWETKTSFAEIVKD